jgi:hypothetical protein
VSAIHLSRNKGDDKIMSDDYFVHESSYVDDGVVIGNNTRILHFSDVYAQYTVPSHNRNILAAHLKERCIPIAVYYPKCLHEQPAFTCCGYKQGDS